MAAFEELEWRRFDVWALLVQAGVATIDERDRSQCLTWLRNNGYDIDSLDFADGLRVAVPELGRMLRWQEQFGYSLGPDSRSLDALRDGFPPIGRPDTAGKVLELLNAEIGWKEDEQWFLGLLSIVEECSRQQLALGKRFFAMLVLPNDSQLIGRRFAEIAVHRPFHRAAWNQVDSERSFD